MILAQSHTEPEQQEQEINDPNQSPSDIYGTQLSMFSRAGKGTTSLYLAFRDKSTDQHIESKVAQFIYKDKASSNNRHKSNFHSFKNSFDGLDSVEEDFNDTDSFRYNEFSSSQNPYFNNQRYKKGEQKNLNKIQAQIKMDKEIKQAKILKEGFPSNLQGLTESQMRLERLNQIKKKNIQIEMKKIDKIIHNEKLKPEQQLLKSLKQQDLPIEEINQKIQEFEKKKLAVQFPTTSRQNREFAFRNKTEAPSAGQYYPERSIQSLIKVPSKILHASQFSEEAKQKKIEIEFNKNQLCDHLAKSISRNNIIGANLRNQNQKSLNTQKIVEDSSMQSLTPFEISLTPAKTYIKQENNEKISAQKMNQASDEKMSPVGQVKKQKVGKLVRYQHIIGEMPNGKTIQLNLHDQNLKFQLELAKRQGKNISLMKSQNKSKDFSQTLDSKLGYDYFFKTKDYHIINGVGDERSQINVIPNDISYLNNKQSIEKNAIIFEKYSKRKSIIDHNISPNEKRFENINKDPDILTNKKRVSVLKFEKQAPRNIDKILYFSQKNNADYDNADKAKQYIMEKLSKGSIQFGRQEKRRIGEGFRGYLPNQKDVLSLSVVNDEKASEFKIQKNKHGINIEKMKPRDLYMYSQTDQLHNVLLDNSKEERMKFLNRNKNLRKFQMEQVMKELNQKFIFSQD